MASNVTRDHHSLRRNLKLNDNYISNNGDDEGIKVDNDGIVSIHGGDLTLMSGVSLKSINGAELNLTAAIDENTTILNRQTGATTKCLIVDQNHTSASTGTGKGLFIDYTDIGGTGFGETLTSIALDIDLTSSAATKYGNCTNYGIDLDVVGGTDGTQVNHGMDISCAGADWNYGISVTSSHRQLALNYDGSSGVSFTVADGSHLTIATFVTETANITLNASGDITLDADGDQVSMKFGGATGQIDFTNANSGDGVIQQKVDAKDLVIKQFDGSEVVRFTDGGDVKVTNTVYFAAETSTAVGHLGTETIDWNVSQKQKLTITGTGITIQFTDPAGVCNLLLKVVQGDGSDVVGTWDSDILWAGGSPPTLSTGNGDIDIISFYFDGTNYFGVATLDFA